MNGHVELHAIGPTLEVPRLRPALRSINEKVVEDRCTLRSCAIGTGRVQETRVSRAIDWRRKEEDEEDEEECEDRGRGLIKTLGRLKTWTTLDSQFLCTSLAITRVSPLRRDELVDHTSAKQIRKGLRAVIRAVRTKHYLDANERRTARVSRLLRLFR